MQIFERKRQMLYKNEAGGRIMVRISLPQGESDSDLNRLYNMLCERYFSAAKSFIGSVTEPISYFFEVSYESEYNEDYVKIKRLSALKAGARTLKASSFTDVFRKEDLKLKK